MTPNSAEQVFQLVDRPVWVITAAANQRRGGLTATWVSEASIDRQRPSVLVAIAPNHYTAELIDAAGFFGVHLLAADQAELALHFAIGSGRNRDKLAGIDHELLEGTPILAVCLAWLLARVCARLATGDRIYYWADVWDARTLGGGPPLTERTLFRAAGELQRQQLAEGRAEDVALLRPLQQQWRQELPPLLRPAG